MRKLFFSLFVCFSFNAFSKAELLITQANIHVGDGTDAFIADILIKDGVIQRIANGISPKNTWEILDARGLTLTPGLISPTSNIGIVEINALDVTRDDESEFLKSGFSVFNAFNPNSTLIPWNRSNGVTGTISSPSWRSFPFWGLGSYFLLDASMKITGIKDLAMYGRLGASGRSRAEDILVIESLFKLALSIDVDNIEDELDNSHLAEKFELQPDDILAIRRVLKDKLPFVLETNRAADILQAVRLKETYGLNLILASVEEAPLVLEVLAASNIPVIIDPMDNIPDSFDELASNLDRAAILDRAGITIMFSTQRSHNYHLMRQGAGNAVAYGMNYNNAIKGMTKAVADIFRIPNRGAVQVGNYADLVIWDGDPLEPATFPKYVLINGESMDLTTRSTRLTERYSQETSKPRSYLH
ncbi:MAG: amidohydrolase family protein [Gammaproteobacteria bacterium]